MNMDLADQLKDADVSYDDLQRALSDCILSVSGWRAVFSADGDEESHTEAVRPALLMIAAMAAEALIRYLGKKSPRVVVGSDARPTGKALTSVIVRTMIALGAEVSFTGVTAAPEIMAYSNDGFDGFFYVSASHNPVGHNGFKCGVSGGVLTGDENEKLKDLFLSIVREPDAVVRIRNLSASASEEECMRVFSEMENEKEKALRYYESFVMRTASADDSFRIPFGIVVDFNGSARAASIDIPFLEKHGCRVKALNSTPSSIVHAIVPEGENLETARKALETAHSEDPSFMIGYMPDNDGDRGNFVCITEDGRAVIIDAQRVFALVSSIDLMHARLLNPEGRVAIAVNGPTSLLSDDIAKRLGVSVFRSDIGEANVVMLAEKLREEGYIVPVCGEGSNGGIITYPARVRDPMNSVMTIAKLWSVPGLYDHLMESLGGEKGQVRVDSLLSAFPEYYMTPAFSRDAVLKIKSHDFDALKLEYEKILISEIDENKPSGCTSWEIKQYEGSHEETGLGPEHRPCPSSGGYKVQFSGSDGVPAAYLWLSRSRTEPVCRVMVCIKGDNRKEHDRLLSWQRSMVERADRALI